MVLAFVKERFTTRVDVVNFLGKLKTVQIIREIFDLLRPNPNETQPFHRQHSSQTVEPIRIFQKTKEKMTSIHFGRDKSHPFAKKHVGNTFTASVAVIFHCLFLAYVADGMEEIMDSVYMTTAAISMYISFMNMIFKTAKIFVLLDKLEVFINQSELDLIYSI